MNKKERDALYRLDKVLSSIPFPGSGTATTTTTGLVGYTADMRAIMRYVSDVMKGLIYNGFANFELGYDYEEPYYLLEALEEWVRDRNEDGWNLASEYSFDEYFDRYREKLELELKV